MRTCLWVEEERLVIARLIRLHNLRSSSLRNIAVDNFMYHTSLFEFFGDLLTLMPPIKEYDRVATCLDQICDEFIAPSVEHFVFVLAVVHRPTR